MFQINIPANVTIHKINEMNNKMINGVLNVLSNVFINVKSMINTKKTDTTIVKRWENNARFA